VLTQEIPKCVAVAQLERGHHGLVLFHRLAPAGGRFLCDETDSVRAHQKLLVKRAQRLAALLQLHHGQVLPIIGGY